MIPTLAQISSLNSPFALDIEEYSAAGCDSIELWWGKVDHFLSDHSIEELLSLLKQHKMQTPVASFVGGLIVNAGESLEAAQTLFAQRCKTAQTIGVKTLVLAEDFPLPASQENLDALREKLSRLANHAADHGLKLALEFQARSPFCNNLQTAVSLVEELNNPALGICLDAFHFFVGPSDLPDLEVLSTKNLFHVQLSDIAGVPRELASDSDRILPNDGDFSSIPLLQKLNEIGYEGCVSVELMNPQIFQIPARSFGEVAIASLNQAIESVTDSVSNV